MPKNCLHDSVYRKYVMGMQDDFVCQDCDETFANRAELEQAREDAKKRAEEQK